MKFRVLHISDLHLSIRPNRQHWIRIFKQSPLLTLGLHRSGSLDTYPSSYSDDIAQVAANFIYGNRRRFDLAIISGDLATSGRDEDLRAARRYILEPAERSYFTATKQPTLRPAIGEFLLMPGNHDRYRDVEGNAGGNQFEFVFPREWSGTWPAAGVRGKVLSRGDETIGFVAADFCLRRNADALKPERLYKWGRGKAYSDVIKALVDRTNSIRQRWGDIPVVWISHFPPRVAPGYYRLLQDADLIAFAKESRVQLILSGHLHRKIEHRTPEGILLFCAGSMTSCDEAGDHWIHFIDLEVNGNRLEECAKTDFLWSDKEGEYITKSFYRSTL